MKYPTRIYYTETDKALMWDRWQKGESQQIVTALKVGAGHLNAVSIRLNFYCYFFATVRTAVR